MGNRYKDGRTIIQYLGINSFATNYRTTIDLPGKAPAASSLNSFPALKGEFAGLRKLRIGNYRAIYAILNKNVLILRVGRRKDVYL